MNTHIMKKRTISWILLVQLIILAGCRTKPQPLQALLNSPCQPPCWQNITPGVTTVSDAILLVDDIPGLDPNQSAWTGTWYGYSNVFAWDFINNGQAGEIYFLDEIVSDIVLTGHLGLNLEQVITTYGIPDQVVLNKSRGGDTLFFYVNLLYPDIGMVFSFKSGNLKKISLRPDMELNRVIFVNPDVFIETLSREPSWISIDEFNNFSYSWPGFEDITIEK